MVVSWYLVTVLAVVVTVVTSDSNPQYGIARTLPGKSCETFTSSTPLLMANLTATLSGLGMY